MIERKRKNRGASTLEACVALPIVFLSLFGAFAIAESFFVASKMIHLSTGAAISLRAVAQAGQKITPAPQFSNLVYSTDPAKRNQQLSWYNQGATVTGFDSTSQVHRMFLNLFLGTLVQIYPEAASPPPISNGQVELRKSVEAKLSAVGSDTELKLRTAPVLGNILKKMFFMGNKELVFSTTATIANMSIVTTPDDDMDNTYVNGVEGLPDVQTAPHPLPKGVPTSSGTFTMLTPEFDDAGLSAHTAVHTTTVGKGAGGQIGSSIELLP